MGEGLDLFHEFETQVGDNWFWDDGSPVLDEDRVLYFAAFMWNRGMEQMHSAGALQLELTTDPTKALTGEIREGMKLKHTSSHERIWPEVVRGLPNPSDIVWGYSPLRDDYAGAAPLAEFGGRVCIIAFPGGVNDVLSRL